jgi:alpha-ketoglutarate-dependent 2,4-dichlorophenoxyacetate dioxygenase
VSAIDRHAVLVFPGEKLTEKQQIDFSQCFGSIAASNGVLQTGIKRRVSDQLVDISNLDENSLVLSAGDRRRMFALGNQLWHTDSSFKRTPAKYSLLHAHSVTPEGGETQLADMRAAYDALPAQMKSRLEGLMVEHSIFHSRAKLGFTDFSADERSALPPVHHPLVRMHPGSERKALYLASHASHVVGWPIPDGRMLINDLMEHATQPVFVYTHTWRPGDLVMWDNRCTMHRGRPYDEAAHRRDLRRATIDDVVGRTEGIA